MNILLIFIGAGIGGVCRYGIANGIYTWLGREFPYGTLVVNVSGSFLMGLLSVIILDRFSTISSPLRALLLIGLLGGYTTFSSFSLETITLFENGLWLKGLLNIILSVALCLSATALGIIGARQL